MYWGKQNRKTVVLYLNYNFIRNLKERKNEKKVKQSKQTVGKVYLKVHPTLKWIVKGKFIIWINTTWIEFKSCCSLVDSLVAY